MPSSKKSFGVREVRVGLLVVVAIGVLIFLILNASGDISPFSKKIHLRAQFANADGLRPGSEVRLAGVRIGKVDDVRLLPPSDNPNAKVEAAFSIDSVIDGRPATDLIRNDSTASLASPSILGAEKIINVTPGTAISPSAALFSDLHPVTPDAPNVIRHVVDGSGSPSSYTRLTINPGRGKDLFTLTRVPLAP